MCFDPQLPQWRFALVKNAAPVIYVRCREKSISWFSSFFIQSAGYRVFIMEAGKYLLGNPTHIRLPFQNWPKLRFIHKGLIKDIKGIGFAQIH